MLSEFMINGKPVRSLQEICDGFVEHYAMIGKKLSSKIGDTRGSYKDYLTDKNERTLLFKSYNTK